MRFKKISIIVITLRLLCYNTGYCQERKTIELEKLVITPYRVEQPLSGVASSVTVLESRDLKRKGVTSVKEALRSTPGIRVAESGSFGGLTAVYIRGAESHHTLFLIDGVKIYDPMQPSAGFNPANLTLDNVDRIEIIRGSHSTFYGSDAIGGVINVVTKKGKGKPKGSVLIESGSFYTVREAVDLNGEIDKLAFSLGFSHLYTGGISRADEREFNNDEKDSHENISLATRLDYKLNKSSDTGIIFRRVKSKTELDDGTGITGDDPNQFMRTGETMLTGYFKQDLSEWWDMDTRASWTRIKRTYRDDFDSVDLAEDTHSWYLGDSIQVKNQNNIYILDFDTFTAGMDFIWERGDHFWRGTWGITDVDAERSTNLAFFLNNRVHLLDKLFITTGMRFDEHSRLKLHRTYKVDGAYIMDTGTKLKAAWGTGFKAPSLYQLFDPRYGNEDLDPERSESREVGIEQELLDKKVKLGFVVFKNKFKDLIDWTAGGYINIDRAKSQGYEMEGLIALTDDLTVSGNFTHLKAIDETNDQELLRRPHNRFNIVVNYLMFDKLNLNMDIEYVGSRLDWPRPIKLPRYVVANFTANYNVTKYLEIFCKIKNLFDKHYQEVNGYGTPGFSVYAGTKISF